MFDTNSNKPKSNANTKANQNATPNFKGTVNSISESIESLRRILVIQARKIKSMERKRAASSTSTAKNKLNLRIRQRKEVFRPIKNRYTKSKMLLNQAKNMIRSKTSGLNTMTNQDKKTIQNLLQQAKNETKTKSNSLR